MGYKENVTHYENGIFPVGMKIKSGPRFDADKKSFTHVHWLFFFKINFKLIRLKKGVTFLLCTRLFSQKKKSNTDEKKVLLITQRGKNK